MKVYVPADFTGISTTKVEGWPVCALERYHKDDAIGNIGAFLQAGFAGQKQWRLFADQGSGFNDTGLVVPPEVMAFVWAYSLVPYQNHPED